MNLHAIAGPLVTVVLGETVGKLLISTGYATDAAGKRSPGYDTYEDVQMGVQALSGPELKLVDGLNLQGVLRGVYLYGAVDGVQRVKQKGGDLLVFAEPGCPNTFVWLVGAVLETWPGWCKVAVTQQTDEVPL